MSTHHDGSDGQEYKSSDETLIQFAFRVYAEPKVEQLCLKLQNEYHANVNILLWACWLQNRSIQLEASWLDDVLISVDTLSQLTVGRLQEVRRVIKDSSGFTRVQAKMLNKHILSAELTAEKIFLQRLEDMTYRFLESQQSPLEIDIELIRPEYYLSFLHIPNAFERAALLMSLSRRAELHFMPSTI